MIVVIPFCPADHVLAVKSVRWMAELERATIPLDAVLLAAKECTKDQIEAVQAATRDTFQSVEVHQQRETDSRPYPAPCNAMFREACALMRQKAQSWLWWEPDCVLLKKGGLQSIADEYVAAGRPFMGVSLVNNFPAINGCAVYPPNPVFYAHNLLSKPEVPWDVAGGQLVYRFAHITNLMQHVWSIEGFERSSEAPVFNSPRDLALLKPEAVMFHRCKDGSLIERLRERISKPPVVQNNQPAGDIGVVVTTHNRPEKCLRAVKSCQEAGFKEIVVTCCSGEELPSLPQEVRKIVSGETSNDSWLAGVEACKSSHVLILHDDDMVLPRYLKAVSPHLGEPFLVYPARFHREKDPPSYVCGGPVKEEGVFQTSRLTEYLQQPGQLSITPVRGLFKRDDLIAWLSEAGHKLGSSCYMRPGFLVGNDLWIWLSAVNKYQTFYNLEEPIVSLGCDPDSTTVASCSGEDKASGLKAIYDGARKAFQAATKIAKVCLSGGLRLHIVTIILDGAPFLVTQLQTFNRLNLDWHWYIVEGVSNAAKDTSWCRPIPGRRSKDGTTDILRDLTFHHRVSVYNKELWPSKVDMVNFALKDIRSSGVLMQIDADEFWQPRQIEEVVKLFEQRTDAHNAMFWCRYFVGPGLVMEDRDCFANNPSHEWRRAWRFTPGQLFLTHEPPVLSGQQNNVIPHAETDKLGLVFDHYSYVLQSQVEFKQRFYGYSGAVDGWQELQRSTYPKLSQCMPWMGKPGQVRTI